MSETMQISGDVRNPEDMLHLATAAIQESMALVTEMRADPDHDKPTAQIVMNSAAQLALTCHLLAHALRAEAQQVQVVPDGVLRGAFGGRRR